MDDRISQRVRLILCELLCNAYYTIENHKDRIDTIIEVLCNYVNLDIQKLGHILNLFKKIDFASTSSEPRKRVRFA